MLALWPNGIRRPTTNRKIPGSNPGRVRIFQHIKKTSAPEPSVTTMFCTPSNILAVGPSGSGKTVFVSELLKEPHRYFRPVPKRLHYCYGAIQPLLQTLRNDYKVGLQEGLPTATDLKRWFGNDGGILVLDDLMVKGGNDKQVLDLFTKHSHHRNITVVYLCQDMFPREKYAKTINRQRITSWPSRALAINWV